MATAKKKDAPTMVDVARDARVAIGTVSRVVNGQPVGDEYRAKVAAAIERLGYQLNNSGRVLRTDKTNIIALIIPRPCSLHIPQHQVELRCTVLVIARGLSLKPVGIIKRLSCSPVTEGLIIPH